MPRRNLVQQPHRVLEGGRRACVASLTGPASGQWASSRQERWIRGGRKALVASRRVEEMERAELETGGGMDGQELLRTNVTCQLVS
jgi:hypothetical protein